MVRAETASAALSGAGPSRLVCRVARTLITVASSVRRGEWCGRLERSSSPAAPSHSKRFTQSMGALARDTHGLCHVGDGYSSLDTLNEQAPSVRG